jgi:hypothetical protein
MPTLVCCINFRRQASCNEKAELYLAVHGSTTVKKPLEAQWLMSKCCYVGGGLLVSGRASLTAEIGRQQPHQAWQLGITQ